MSVKVNRTLVFWALGVVQPASASDLIGFIGSIYPDVRPLPSIGDIRKLLDTWVERSDIQRVHARSRLYSLTSWGNSRIEKRLRHQRDKLRILLLKSARGDRFEVSGEASQGLLGVSPSIDVSSGTKEVARPINTVGIPRVAQNTDRIYWPRLLKQLDFPVGFDVRSPDTFFDYFSFPTVASIHRASDNPASERDLSITDLALAIGISARLLTSFTHSSDNHYRVFEIGKRGGGSRVISSPRLFLKVTQYWVLDYLLHALPVHEACHSYQRGRSILTNAIGHVGKGFVGNVDIHDYFGSVSRIKVKRLLLENGFGGYLASTVSKLATLNGSLPQGAPTSPLISNAYLFHLDEKLTDFCKKFDLTYTRYADDITISGESRDYVGHAIDKATEELLQSGLRLNNKKTRIASRGGQQRVTGVVVNSKAQPPRKLRREIRAMFHQAGQRPDEFQERLPQLRGYLNYLKSYPALVDTRDLAEYSRIIRALLK